MFKKLIVICLVGWQALAYGLNNKLYVGGYGGYSSPEFTTGNLVTDPTHKGIVGGGAHFQFMKYLAMEFNLLPFLGSVVRPITDQNIQPSIKSEANYKTIAGELMIKPIFETSYSFFKVYGKLGGWGIISSVKNKKIENGEISDPYYPKGYGIGLGAGFNWVFYPRFSRKLALDVSGIYCFPFPNNNKNYIKTGFPLFKAGLGYHFL